MNLGKVGIVFGGGGLAGCYSIGFIKALTAKGIKPDYIQGVSVGAITSAKLLSTDWNIEDVEKSWLLIQSLGPSSIFDRREIPMNAARLNPSLFSNQKILKLMIETINLDKIINSPIEYHIIAYNCNKKEVTVFSNRNEIIKNNPELLKKTILASIGLYGFLPPILINEDWHADGMSFMLNEPIKAKCDTIFILLNNNWGKNQTNYGKLSFYKQIISGFHDLVIQINEREIKYAKSRGYGIIENNPSGRFDDIDPFYKKIRRKIKHIVDNTVEAVKTDAEIENIFLPHRIVILTPPNPIPTLDTIHFQQADLRNGYQGDIKTAIEQCSHLPDEFWEKLE
jgi:predicted patatin/cPLA2 family phospholipase